MQFTNASVLGLGFGVACGIGLILATWIRWFSSSSSTRTSSSRTDHKLARHSENKLVVVVSAEVTDGSDSNDHSQSTHISGRSPGDEQQRQSQLSTNRGKSPTTPTTTMTTSTTRDHSSELQTSCSSDNSHTTMYGHQQDAHEMDSDNDYDIGIDIEQPREKRQHSSMDATSTPSTSHTHPNNKPQRSYYSWFHWTPQRGRTTTNTTSTATASPPAPPTATAAPGTSPTSPRPNYGITFAQLIAMSQEAACTNIVVPPVWQVQHPINGNNNNEISFALTDDGWSAVSGISGTGHDSTTVFTEKELDQLIEETVADIVQSLTSMTPQQQQPFQQEPPQGNSNTSSLARAAPTRPVENSAAVTAAAAATTTTMAAGGVDPALLRSTLTNNIRRILEQASSSSSTMTGTSSFTTTNTTSMLAKSPLPQRLVFVEEGDEEAPIHC